MEEMWRWEEAERKRKEEEDRNTYALRSWRFMLGGDWFEGFTWLGVAGSVLVGLIPVVGQAADARDLLHALTHTGEKDLWGNIFSIGLGLVAFVPLIGDLKQVKHLDEFGVIAKHGDEIIDAAGELGKRSNEIGDVLKNIDKLDEAIEGLEAGIKHGNEVGDALKYIENFDGVEAGAKYGNDIVDDAFPRGVGKIFVDTPFDDAGNLKPNIIYKSGEFEYLYETDSLAFVTLFCINRLAVSN